MRGRIAESVVGRLLLIECGRTLSLWDASATLECVWSVEAARVTFVSGDQNLPRAFSALRPARDLSAALNTFSVRASSASPGAVYFSCSAVLTLSRHYTYVRCRYSGYAVEKQREVVRLLRDSDPLREPETRMAALSVL